MGFTYTDRAARESMKTKLEPQLVLEIDGLATLFGAIRILRLIRIGDDGLLIGNDWRIGGLTEVDDQMDVLSLDGTGTKINQQIQPDKGAVSSVSSIQVGIIDKSFIGSQLISPGVLLTDIMGAKATLWMGFKNTSFKQDFIPVFAGIIDETESGAGLVKLNIAHPEQLKRQDIFVPVESELSATISPSATTIPLQDASQMPTPVLGPDGVTYDPAIKFYVKIEDEIIRYTGVSGNNLTGCTRAELGTVAVTHTYGGDPVPSKSIVQISDSAVYIALKIMLSGKNGFYREGLPIARYLHPTPTETVANSIYFEGIDLTRDYGVAPGDFVTITGAVNGVNNCAAKVIQSIEINESGSYAIIAGVSFVEETPTAAVVAVRSQFDTLGYGLNLGGDQVDVAEHIFWYTAQLANITLRFNLVDKISGKDFLDKEVYLPIGAYSIPRQGRCSMGYHIGPVIRGPLKVFNRDNIKNPDKIKLKRSINRNFYNTIVTKFDKLVSDDKYVSGSVSYSVESQNQIPVGFKVLNIVSQGMRRTLDGLGIANRVANRYLGRYKKAAEYFEGLTVLFKDGSTVEPGDNIIVDFDQIPMTNLADGTRTKPAKIYTVTNRSLDLKTGEVGLSITDANFDGSERYGVVSPSSMIVGGTVSTLLIEDSFGAIFPGDEAKKWEEYVGLPIIVHSDDWSVEHVVTLQSINPGNRYELILDPSTPLPVPPVAGWIIDIANYPDNTDANENALYKTTHAFLGPSIEVVSGVDDLSFNVLIGDATRFQIGGLVRVHAPDYSNDSDEVIVQSVVGTLVTVATPLGFTPVAGDIADSLPMPDGAETYRLI